MTTVIVGNCGISAAPVALRADPPDPMNLLGEADAFRYPDFASYVRAIASARPAVNVAAPVGHTALRSNQMDRLDRAASAAEIAAMRAQLEDALQHGALGLSTGLANAFCAPTEEVLALAEPLAQAGALYATHLRSEFAEILDAMDEAFRIGRHARVPVVISQKCAGVPNWGRSGEVLDALDAARRWQPVGCDCYPYTASSSTLDLKQVTSDFDITVIPSEPHPEMGGKSLAEIAAGWELDLHETARRLQPAGAVYHCMEDADVDRILSHPATVIGSDGLPNDPLPHPGCGAPSRVCSATMRATANCSRWQWPSTDDRPAGRALRPARARPGARRLLGRPGAVRRRHHPRRGHLRRPHAARRRHCRGLGQRRVVLARAPAHRHAGRPLPRAWHRGRRQHRRPRG